MSISLYVSRYMSCKIMHVTIFLKFHKSCPAVGFTSRWQYIYFFLSRNELKGQMAILNINVQWRYKRLCLY